MTILLRFYQPMSLDLYLRRVLRVAFNRWNWRPGSKTCRSTITDWISDEIQIKNIDKVTWNYYSAMMMWYQYSWNILMLSNTAGVMLSVLFCQNVVQCLMNKCRILACHSFKLAQHIWSLYPLRIQLSLSYQAKLFQSAIHLDWPGMKYILSNAFKIVYPYSWRIAWLLDQLFSFPRLIQDRSP